MSNGFAASVARRFWRFDDSLPSAWPEAISGAVVGGIFFVGFIGWAALTPLDAAVVAQGSVIAAGNRQAVQHLDGGIVRALHVSEGAEVTEGDVLLELDDTDLKSQERALFGRLIELEAHRARLLAEDNRPSALKGPVRWDTLNVADRAAADAILDRQRRELLARSDAKSARTTILQHKIEQLNARLPGYAQEKDAILRQLNLLDGEITRLSDLREKGLTTVGRLRELEREQASLQGNVGRIDSEISGTLEALSEAKVEIISLGAELRVDRAGELREVDTMLSEVAPRYEAVVAQLGRTRLRAPASGHVVSLTAFTVGGIIEPKAHVMDIVPKARALIIEATVPPESGEDISIGAAAQIRLIGVGERNAPVIHGVIDKVSADKLIDEYTGMSYYRIEASVSDEELGRLFPSAVTGSNSVRPGIPAEVVVPIRQRTALQYLVEPLTQAFWKSFREK